MLFQFQNQSTFAQVFSEVGAHVKDNSDVQVTVPLCNYPIFQMAGTERTVSNQLVIS